MTLYFVIPYNEGQELNYIEDFNGNTAQAKIRAKRMAIDLKNALPQATITVEVQNAKSLKKVAEII
jgi:hypothetical protein